MLIKGCSGTCLLGHERDVKVRYVNGWMNKTGIYNTFSTSSHHRPSFHPTPHSYTTFNHAPSST